MLRVSRKFLPLVQRQGTAGALHFSAPHLTRSQAKRATGARHFKIAAPLRMDRDTAQLLQEKTGFGKAELEALHMQFLRRSTPNQTMDKAHFEESMRLIGMEDPIFIDRCFSAADVAKTGEIDFKELATSLSVLLHGSESEMADFEFKVWDADGDGALTKADFLQFYMHSRKLDPKFMMYDDNQLQALADKVFLKVDTKKTGVIDAQEFQEAVQNRQLIVGSEFYRHLHDPLGTKMAGTVLAALSHDERQLLILIGERVSAAQGEVFAVNGTRKTRDAEDEGYVLWVISAKAIRLEDSQKFALLSSKQIKSSRRNIIPLKVGLNSTEEQPKKFDCIYLVLDGIVEVSYPGVGNLDTIEASTDSFLHEEAVFFIGSHESVVFKEAKAISDVKLLRIAAADFLEAYQQGSMGAQSMMARIKDNMHQALQLEEQLLANGKAKEKKFKEFVSWKRLNLLSSDKILVRTNINKSLAEMEYAVRGLVPITAERIQAELAAGDHSKPFKEILYCDIGNPHSVGQKPISFYREVLALVDCPQLLDNPKVGDLFETDVIERARELVANIKGGTGSYSHSQGIEVIRQHVAAFIEARDGHPANPKDIFLTNGASSGIQMLLNTLIADPRDAVLIPIPQYPIYSALVRLLDGEQIGYHMDESKGWALDVAELEAKIKRARAEGTNPKALVIINPGNPVGNCLTYEEIEALVRLCKRERLILLADEVYQENVYQDRPFVSVKKVVRDLGHEFDGFELVSFHSTSKGIIGECGRRGGYMELCGFDHEVQAEIYKLASSGLCSNLDGQVMVDLMIRPPGPLDPSYKKFISERDGIFNSLKRKSELLYNKLNSIPGIECQPLQGAMYAFPKIDLPQKAVAAAEQEGYAADTFYALSLLEHTGICAVPGSGFGQREGTHHLRLTFLPSEEKLTAALDLFEAHHKMFLSKYS